MPEAGYGSIPTVSDDDNGAPASPAAVDLKTMCISELFGTCLFIQIGIAVNCASTYQSPVPASYIIWGFALMMGIYVSGARSGGHLNPGVTLGFAVARPADFPWSRVLPYWCAQFLGAFVAGILSIFMYRGALANFEKENGIVRGDAASLASAGTFGCYWGDDVNGPLQAFFIEAFGTGVLVFVIMSMTHPKNAIPPYVAPFTIGSILMLLAGSIGGLTGGSFNPARDFGPRLVTFFAGWGAVSMTNFWVYLFAPLVGGPVGALLADKVVLA